MANFQRPVPAFSSDEGRAYVDSIYHLI